MEMNAILCLALGLLATAALCHGQCTSLPEFDPVTNKPVPDCRDDEGVLHSIGDVWIKNDYYECVCVTSGLECCNRVEANNDCIYNLMYSQEPDSDCVPQSAVV